MKRDKNKYDSKGQLKNGLFKEYFKDGTLSCVGEYLNGEKTGEWEGIYKFSGNLVREKIDGTMISADISEF